MDHSTMREERKRYLEALRKVEMLKRRYEREKAKERVCRPIKTLPSEDLAKELEARGYKALADDLRQRMNDDL